MINNILKIDDEWGEISKSHETSADNFKIQIFHNRLR